MKFRQINEGFEWVFKVDTPEEQVARLKQWAPTNQTLVPIVRIGVGAEKPEWGLPEGMPSTTKLQKDIPDGMGETTLTLEWRRIRQFMEPGSNMKKLPTWKQESNWVQILEGLHHREAEVLTAIKDGKLLDMYPKLEAMLPLLGITEYNKPEKPKAKRTRKTKAAAAKV